MKFRGFFAYVVAVPALLTLVAPGGSDSVVQRERAATTPARAAAGAPSDTIEVHRFLSYTPDDSTIDLKLWTGYGGRNSAFNFDGYYNGNATIAVPLDWRVVATFQNLDANVGHSVGIIEAEMPVPVTGSEATIAFAGAASRAFVGGVSSREKPQTFRFVADRGGKFMIYCGVPGHGPAGMWIWFEVSGELSVPEFRTE